MISGYQPPSDDRLLMGEEKALLASYMKTRRQASADLQSAVETFDKNSKEVKKLSADLESKILRSQQLAASIRSDINQLQQPASSTFKDEYWYLIF